MGCASCAVSSEVAFALTIHVEGKDQTVEAEFCSSECLQQWTCGDCVPPSEWTWGVTESATDDPAADQQPADQQPTHPESESTLARTY